MDDVHKSIENRNIEIDEVGICDVKLPFYFVSKNEYATIALINSGVSISKNEKGAHLSRIIETLNECLYNKVISINDFAKIVQYLSKNVESKNIIMETKFDIIIPSKSPITNKISTIPTCVTIQTKLKDNKTCNDLKLEMNGAMCCPSSKKISKYGAHSQRCLLTTTIFNSNNNIYIEDIADTVSSCFSAPISSVVKREDEKYLTEKAYENPKFSEDLIRDTLIKVKKLYPDNSISAEMTNFESIHSHNVYCKGKI